MSQRELIYPVPEVSIVSKIPVPKEPKYYTLPRRIKQKVIEPDVIIDKSYTLERREKPKKVIPFRRKQKIKY
jgi:hypothetical protein